jgi:hypothetical protein
MKNLKMSCLMTLGFLIVSVPSYAATFCYSKSFTYYGFAIQYNYVDFKDGYACVPAHRHVNGGGWVANTAKVEDAAYIGLNASVFQSAQVLGKSYVEDYAQVYGTNQLVISDHIYTGEIHSPHIRGYARVHNDRTGKYLQIQANVMVEQNAEVVGGLIRGSGYYDYQAAHIQGNALVDMSFYPDAPTAYFIGGIGVIDSASISGFARILDSPIIISMVDGNWTQITDNAVVSGQPRILAGVVKESAKVNGTSYLKAYDLVVRGCAVLSSGSYITPGATISAICPLKTSYNFYLAP